MGKKESSASMEKLFKGNHEMLMTIEKMLIHAEPLAVLIWIVSIMSTGAGWVNNGKNISILDTKTTSGGVEDTYKYAAFVGGVLYASSILFRLFPFTVHASGYLKISGMIMIIYSLVAIVANDDKPDKFYIANVGVACYLLLCSVFMLRYY